MSMLCSAARESPLAHSEHFFFKRVQIVKRPYPYCFVQQQGKAHLPTLNMPPSYKIHLLQSSNPCFLTPANALFSSKRKPTCPSEHSFFKRVQLVKSPYPCFLTPLQGFVQQQGKAHLPTLNMPPSYKIHHVQSSNPCFLTPANALFSSKGKPTCPSEHSFFKRVQLVKSHYPCFLTPLQGFVQQQGKAHLPTLNIPSLKECNL